VCNKQSDYRRLLDEKQRQQEAFYRAVANPTTENLKAAGVDTLEALNEQYRWVRENRDNIKIEF